MSVCLCDLWIFIIFFLVKPVFNVYLKWIYLNDSF